MTDGSVVCHVSCHNSYAGVLTEVAASGIASVPLYYQFSVEYANYSMVYSMVIA